ncbi:DUF481 domain-containing protein [Neiella marina]|uniref:DUF481 domain-containing protein n=1 Tax=Neiella holothuriorum TaxID=2870530 RepID=A0ABS7EIF4_9GAMM|nr:DUF481 domain-containing protein [Neiella holothuriorum]MBW8191531.1 DUF481 domain-containing protein [Neiella holothuriorum]
MFVWSIKHCWRKTLAPVIGLYLVCISFNAAGQWSPPPPKNVESTWIQLVSGEWVKGDVIAMYHDKLKFDSDKLGMLSINWTDIVTMHSAGEFGIFTESVGNVEGRLDRIDDRVVITTPEGQQLIDAYDVVSIAPVDDEPFSQWSAKASFGYSVRQGNNDESEFNASANIERRKARSRLVIDYLGYVSVKDDNETANNHRLTGVRDTFVSRNFFWRPFQGELFVDKVQNIDHRTTLSGGFGYRILDEDDVEWDVSTTAGYQITYFGSVEEGEDDHERTPAFTASTVYDKELTKWLDWKTTMQITIVNDVSGRYTHHLVSTISSEITKYIDLDFSVVWDRIEKPRADEDGVVPENDDYRMVVGVGIEY